MQQVVLDLLVAPTQTDQPCGRPLGYLGIPVSKLGALDLWHHAPQCAERLGRVIPPRPRRGGFPERLVEKAKERMAQHACPRAQIVHVRFVLRVQDARLGLRRHQRVVLEPQDVPNALVFGKFAEATPKQPQIFLGALDNHFRVRRHHELRLRLLGEAAQPPVRRLLKKKMQVRVRLVDQDDRCLFEKQRRVRCQHLQEPACRGT